MVRKAPKRNFRNAHAWSNWFFKQGKTYKKVKDSLDVYSIAGRRLLYRKLLFVIVAIVLLANVVKITVAFSNADNEIEVIGSSFKNSITVNGTAVIGFLLQSETAVSNVVFSYVDQQERLINETMNLIEGNATYGWWKSTIIPKVLEEKVGEETRYHIDATKMKLYVFLPHAVNEIAISESLLGYWSVQAEKVLFSFVNIGFFLILGGVFSVIGVTVALKQKRQKK